MNEFNTDKLGFSQRQIIELFVYSHLLDFGECYSQQIYNEMTAKFPFKKRSRQYIYSVMREMASSHKLLVVQQGRKLLYSITEKGKKEYFQFEKEHIAKMELVYSVLDEIIRDIKNKSTASSPFVQKEDIRYISNIINVRELIRFLMLRELKINGEVYGASVFKKMAAKYGYSNSDSYFYNILRKMENPRKYDQNSIEFPVVESFWADPDAHSVRLYRINENGLDVYPELKESLLAHLIEVRKSIRGIISFFRKESE